MGNDYGAAQPVADWVNNYVYKPAQRVLGVVNKIPSPQQNQDTSWHDSMVRKAQQSYQSQSSPSKPAAKSTPPKYHKGTDYVPKTGPAILKKGEAVLDKEDADKYRATKGKDMAKDTHSRAHSVLGGSHKSKSKGKGKGKGPHHISIRHGKSGGHIVTHSFEPDESGMPQPDEEHIMPDKAALMDHLDQNIPDNPAPQAPAPAPDAAGGTPPAAGPSPTPAGM